MNLRDLFVRIASFIPMEPKRRPYRLEVEAKDIELLTIKDFIQRVCDAAGCTPKEISNIKLAVDEACSNIIRHAYKEKEGGKITMEVGIGFADIMIKIIDYGTPFDFKGVKEPDLNQYVDIGKKGGLGIWLIKKVMSRVVYKAYPDHNELILYRRLSKAPPKELGLKKGTYSVSAKFTMGSAVLILLIIITAYVILSRRQQVLIGSQQADNATALLRTMAAEAAGPAELKNDLELDHLVREVEKGDKDKVMQYVFVVGADGKYLAHSDPTQLFKDYKVPAGVKLAPMTGVQIFRVASPGGPVTDYASALYGPHGLKVGEAHLGVGESSVQDLVTVERTKLQGLMAVITLVIMVGLYLLSRIFIKPFQKILEGVHAMSMGDFNTKIEVESQDEFGQLASIFNDMTGKIQESQKGLMEQERIEKEMQVAQEIQHTLLPAQFPQIEGYEIGATYRAAKEVGGDYYDFFWVDPTTMGIVVADVSGKGVPGSMVMTMIRTAMRLEARENRSASDVLSKVNQHVTADMKKGMFVTMFYIILDSRNRSINFASAGHNPMILYRGKTKEVYFLKPKGFPVGIDLPEDDMFTKNLALQRVSLEKNDMLVIYTDGITEAMDPESNQFGEDRLIRVIKENSHLTPAEFVEKLNEAIAQFTRGAEQHDDITVVAIKEKMKVEQVEFKFRKKLLDLVDKKGLSVVEACRQMKTSPKTYYRLKKLFDERGKEGLKPVAVKRAQIQELSLPQQQAVMAVVREKPSLGAKAIAEAIGKSTNPPMKLEPKLIASYLKRKGLSDEKSRKAMGFNEVDTAEIESDNKAAIGPGT